MSPTIDDGLTKAAAMEGETDWDCLQRRKRGNWGRDGVCVHGELYKDYYSGAQSWTNIVLVCF